MTFNTKASGWSQAEIEAAERIAARQGKTVEEVQQEAIRRQVRFAGHGAHSV